MIPALWLLLLCLTAQAETPLDQAASLNAELESAFSEGDFQQAATLGRQALALRERHLPQGHPDLTESYANLGVILQQLGKLDAARPYLEQAVQGFAIAYGDPSTPLAQALNNLALLEDSLGDFERATAHYLHALSAYRGAEEVDEEGVATVLNNLAELEHRLGEYDAAKAHYEECLELRLRHLGERHRLVATTYGNLASVLRTRGELEEALAHASRALELQSELLGPDSPYVGVAWLQRGEVFAAMRRSRQAEQDARAALTVLEGSLGPTHPYTAKALQALGAALRHQARLTESEDMYRRSWEVVAQLHPPGHPVRVSAERDLAVIWIDLGWFDQALPMLRESLTTLESTYGPVHLEVAATLSTLGAVHDSSHEYAAAIACHQRALDIYRSVMGTSHLATLRAERALLVSQRFQLDADTLLERTRSLLARLEQEHGELEPLAGRLLNDLAGHLLDRARFTESAEVLEEAERRTLLASGRRSRAYMTVLKTRAALLSATWDTDGALAAAEERIALAKDLLGTSHPTYARAVASRGVVRMVSTESEQARDDIDTTLQILESVYGPDHPTTARHLQSLARVQLHQGDLDSALENQLTALALLRRSFGDRDPEIGRAQRVLAYMYLRQNRLEAAEVACREAVELLSQRYPVGHPDIAASQQQLADLHLRLGEHEEAERWVRRALQSWEDNFGPDHPHSGMAMSILGRVLRETGRLDEAEAVLNRHITVLETTSSRPAALSASLALLGQVAEDRGDLPRARRLQSQALASQEESLKLVDSLSDREAARFTADARATLDRWLHLHREEEDQTEAWAHTVRWKQAGTWSLTARTMAARQDTTPEARQVLDALVALRRALAQTVFEELDVDDPAGRTARTNALSAEKERLERRLADQLDVDLSPPSAEAVRAALPPDAVLVDFLLENGTYVARIVRSTGPVRAVELGLAHQLDPLVSGWRKALEARSELADWRAERVAQRLWAPLAQHIAEVERVYLVPDGALFTVPWVALPAGPEQLVLDLHEVHVLGRPSDLIERPGPPAVGLLTVGGVDLSGRSQSACFEDAPLPGSAEESLSLARWWRRNRGGEVEHLTGTGATEQAVLQAAAGKRVVHLATHGFFLTDACLPVGTGANPMLRSGLLLAPDARDDGVLTAEEIAGVDLSGARLVLLSACETALGDLSRPGEGVQGLQRGMALAGAQSVVMSLWGVPDAETALLMGMLVRRLSRGRRHGPARALRTAQRQLRDRNRRHYGHDRPETWAAWIVSD